VITVLVAPGAREVGERLELDADEAHHLKVRRGEHGVRVRFRDGVGSGGTGSLESDGRRFVLTIELVEHAAHPRHSSSRWAPGIATGSPGWWRRPPSLG
jgi:16S rRNA U1498 N3-methylase RsmE